MRIMTDFCAERYGTIVPEYEAPSMQALEDMTQGKGVTPEVDDLVEHGWREIYKLEG